jgi:hypothetical protein
MTAPRARWTATLLALAVMAGFALYLRGANLGTQSRWLPRCGFHFLTGLYCPGCGNTRASYALLHGDVPGALRQNVFFVLGLPFLLFWAGRSWYQWIYPDRLKPLPFRWKRSYSLAIAWAFMAFGVLRNLPFVPFSRLAPVPVKTMESPESAERAAPLPESPPPSER